MWPRVGLGEVDGRGSCESICAEAYFRPWKTPVRLVERVRVQSSRGLDQIGRGVGTPARGEGG